MPDPKVEPVKPAPTEPVKEPVKEPVTEPLKEPVKEPVTEPLKEPVKDPTKVEPGKEPSPLSAKLEGDKIPEKYRGKTFEEALALMETTDGKLTKTEQENAQWRLYYEHKKAEEAAAASGTPVEKPFNPLDHLEKDQAEAVLAIVDARNKPLLDGFSGMLLEYTKSLRPDFKQFEPRIKKIYDSLLPEYKFNPEYGWDFAYRFAKAEAEGTPAPLAPAPAVPGPSATGDTPAGPAPLTEDQKKWAKNMGLSEEEFIKFQKPIDAAKLEEEGGK